jgi:quercetin dioxygenase-like cupin family protein
MEVEMIVGKEENVEPTEVNEKDIEGVSMKVVISPEAGAPNFVMRVFDIQPGGHTAYHTHAWEHEVYVLEGKGMVRQGEKEHLLEKGSFVLVPPGEEHNFANTGDGLFRFICVVPIVG